MELVGTVRLVPATGTSSANVPRPPLVLPACLHPPPHSAGEGWWWSTFGAFALSATWGRRQPRRQATSRWQPWRQAPWRRHGLAVGADGLVVARGRRPALDRRRVLAKSLLRLEVRRRRLRAARLVSAACAKAWAVSSHRFQVRSDRSWRACHPSHPASGALCRHTLCQQAAPRAPTQGEAIVVRLPWAAAGRPA